jgi:hypothetical protein
VTLRSCKGFGSTGMESQIGNLFEGINKPITIYFLGDHDPSGRVIEMDIHQRAQAASGKEFALHLRRDLRLDLSAMFVQPVGYPAVCTATNSQRPNAVNG